MHHPTLTLAYPLTLSPDHPHPSTPTQAPCTIACLRLVISWRARKDLGLFSEPWRLEIDDLCLQVCTSNGSDPDEDEVLQALGGLCPPMPVHMGQAPILIGFF